ncbi:transcription termination factor 3, mitochondrial [Trichosurus vulpecula]|uniref:transcription termination factor 3, mitochondrial n=1 Tax=Trichosurus vulpecula TaxID=9337 RepID=UPI00186AE5CF|nr:transcription termination factor 3, mitochondrial [Trichosurus vulpecula]XP_036598141.1 transcription termination factor 3, mitochondrial [Trichosurus vulpecula]XP_036598143.1 transcription termination factor 3, mitochondrial [Trichosurus vulpecula]
MALSAQQIPKWFYSTKIRNFITVTQIRNQLGRPRKTTLRELLALPQQSSGNFFYWGFKNYRTSSLWNSSQAPSSTRQENISTQDTHPSSLNEVQLKTEATNFDSQVLLEELEDVPPISPLQQISEEDAVQIIAEPPLPPASFTLQDYVDRSETLQKLVLLGVNLSKLEKRPGAGTLLLRLDFKNDIQKILLFLKDIGVEDNQLGAFLTKNYIILAEDLENLKTRVAYLESKKFSKTDISRMVVNAPYLLSFPVDRLDNRLGFFQKELGLNVQKTRDLVIRLPRLLTGSLEPVKENMKVYQLQLGFKHNEIQHMVTRIPKILTASKRKLTETFDYVHNVMSIPHYIIVKFPQVFNSKLLKIKERHSFLTYLGRAQYDPQKPNYISLDKLVSIPDEVFCKEVAKASLQDFEMFLKTL